MYIYLLLVIGALFYGHTQQKNVATRIRIFFYLKKDKGVYLYPQDIGLGVSLDEIVSAPFDGLQSMAIFPHVFNLCAIL
jgi:hypothetical protein